MKRGGSGRDAFGHDTTPDEVLEGIDLSGRPALVMGAGRPGGRDGARALASKGAHRTWPKNRLVSPSRRSASPKIANGHPKAPARRHESRSLRWSPTRNALAMMVRAGFTALLDTKKLPSTT